MMPIPRLDHDTVPRDPQLLVTDLLQHCMQAAHQAIATSHPELGEDDADTLDEAAFIALAVMTQISSLDELLRRYHSLTQGYWTRTEQMHLSF